MVIIAEFGSNPAAYGWNFESWCRAAAQAGATHAKVQLWQTDHFPEAEWEEKWRYEFPRSRLKEFVETAHRYGLKAGASVFDADAVYLTTHLLTCDFLKLAAREQLNFELRSSCVESGKPVYRSVSDLENFVPWRREVTLFAIQHYPARMTGALLTLLSVARFFKNTGWSWGWSSHTRGWLDCAMAARLGAVVIEKHLALERSDPEGGHSLLPGKFMHMVRRVQAWAVN